MNLENRQFSIAVNFIAGRPRKETAFGHVAARDEWDGGEGEAAVADVEGVAAAVVGVGGGVEAGEAVGAKTDPLDRRGALKKRVK